MDIAKLDPPVKFNANLAACWQSLQGGRTIAVYQCLIDITGSVKAAVMLSQLIYWTRHGIHISDENPWIFKSIQQMEEETGLTRKEQRACKERLLDLNLITTDRFYMGAKLAFRVNIDELTQAVCKQQRTDMIELSLTDWQNQSSLFFRRYFSKRIAYHRDLVTLTGCIHAAIMLSHVMQQSVRSSMYLADQQHVYASLTIDDWTELTRLTYKSQRTARNCLKNLNFIVEKHFIASRRIFTLANGKTILSALQTHLKSSKSAPKVLIRGSLPERAEYSLPERAECLKFKQFPHENSHLPKVSFRSAQRENTEVPKGEIQKCPKGKLF